MECPYISKDCKRLEQMTKDSREELDFNSEEDRDNADVIRMTGLSHSANTLIVSFCTTPDYVNCVQYKEYASKEQTEKSRR